MPPDFGHGRYAITRSSTMVRKVTTLLLIGGALAIAACNTVRGAGEDVQSAANCTENAVHGGNC
jgi:predicted small secreted protein